MPKTRDARAYRASCRSCLAQMEGAVASALRVCPECGARHTVAPLGGWYRWPLDGGTPGDLYSFPPPRGTWRNTEGPKTRPEAVTDPEADAGAP